MDSGAAAPRGFLSPPRLRWSCPSFVAPGILRIARATRELAHRRNALEELLHRHRRYANPFLAGRNIGHDAGRGPDHRARADRDVVGQPDASPHHHVISDRAAPRYAGVRREHAVTPDLDVVRDLHQV